MNNLYGVDIRIGGTKFVNIHNASYYSKQYDIIFKIDYSIEIIENNFNFDKKILIETFNKFYKIKKTNNKKNNNKIRNAINLYIIES